MQAVSFDELRSTAERAAWYVHHKSRAIEIDDLKQISWCAVLECQRTYDPARGTPFGGYAYRACIFACTRAARRALRRSILEVYADQLPEIIDEHAASQAFDEVAWRQDVRREVRRIMARNSIRANDLQAVLKERRPEDPGRVTKLRRLLRESRRLRRLLEEVS